MFLGFGGLSWIGSLYADEVNVTLDFPSEIQNGDGFEFTISIANVSARTVKVESIDFSMNYLDGILIEDTKPPTTNIDQYDALGGGETFQSFYFNESIAPNETFIVIFYAKAIRAGDYNGTVDVCINLFFNCQNNVARTIIK